MMDRIEFKKAVMPILQKEKFKTERGTDYTDYIADQLYNSVLPIVHEVCVHPADWQTYIDTKILCEKCQLLR